MRVPFIPRVSRVRGTVLAVVAATVMAFPLGVLASHQFADVPNGNIFHGDIDALVDAGVTAGCGGGNYCPNQAVTRGQMAAFMNRLGALAPGKPPVVNADRIDGLDSSAFSRPIFAVVNANGTLARGVATSSTVQQSTGTYRVTFTRDVSTCAFTGTLGNAGGGFPPVGQIGIAFSDTASPNDIYVETRNSAGTLADAGFHVHASCSSAEGAVTGSGPDPAEAGTDSNSD